MMLSDGKPVPGTAQAWAKELRRQLLLASLRLDFAAVCDLRVMLANRPTIWLGPWEKLIDQVRGHIERAESVLPVFPAPVVSLDDLPADARFDDGRSARDAA